MSFGHFPGVDASEPEFLHPSVLGRTGPDRHAAASGWSTGVAFASNTAGLRLDRDSIEAAIRDSFDELLDYREGASGVVTVKRRGSMLVLQVGGKNDASNASSTQNLIGHLPCERAPYLFIPGVY